MKKPALIFLVILPSIVVAACLVGAAVLVYLVMPGDRSTFEFYIREHPDAGVGTVVLPEDVIRLGLSRGKTSIQGFVQNGRAEVPAGKWRLSTWQMSRSDGAGVEWLAMADYNGGETVDIAAGGETVLDVGEPFREELSVTSADGQYLIMRQLHDRGGALVDIYRGTDAVTPRLRITNAPSTYAAGTYDMTDDFEFG